MDADRKKVTWECLYRYIYTKEDWPFWGLFDFTKPKKGIVTFKANMNKDEEDSCYRVFIDAVEKNMKDKKFYISGDADWNTKKWTSKEQYIEKMHMFPNSSIMPRTGGMNCKKGHLGYRDKFNLFLYKLSGFFEIDKEDSCKRKEYVEKHLWYNSYHLHKPQTSRLTIEPLLEYLNLFDNINDYCKKIYLLDDSDLIDNIILSGIKVNNNERCIDDEIKLAEEYWQKRRTIMESKIPECNRSLLDKDIDAKDYD